MSIQLCSFLGALQSYSPANQNVKDLIDREHGAWVQGAVAEVLLVDGQARQSDAHLARLEGAEVLRAREIAQVSCAARESGR